MRSNPVLLTILCAALAATAACRGGGNGDDDGDNPDGGVDPEDVTLYQIQQGEVDLGTIVNVRGVIVTHIDTYGMRRGEDAWVQEPDGGPWSGMLVYHIDPSVLSDLEPGDIIDIEGAEIAEFALNDDMSGRTVTELQPPQGGALTITVTGSTDVPEPAVVDALAIGQMTDADARDEAWEQWESVLVKVENVTALSELDQIGGEAQDPPFEEFRITGPLNVDTGLSSIEAITRDECLASVTGIFNYFFDYKVLPRSTADIVHGGSGCPADEADAAVCVDEIDNDANGFADCDDNHCSAFAQCVSEATVTAIQMGQIPVGENVSLSGLVVTAVDDIGTATNPNSNKGFWAADAATGAAYNGVYVYTGSAVPTGVVIGATVDVTGEVDEFDLCLPVGNCTVSGDTMTEIDAREGTVTVLAETATPVPLTGVAPNTLKDITNGEPYEGVLVQLGPVKVTAISGGDRLTVVDNNGQAIVVDDDAYDYVASTYPVDTCFETLTGVMSLNVIDDERRLMPRTVDDLVVGDGCN